MAYRIRGLVVIHKRQNAWVVILPFVFLSKEIFAPLFCVLHIKKPFCTLIVAPKYFLRIDLFLCLILLTF